jgi:cytochrome c biogenesis protein CcdA
MRLLLLFLVLFPGLAFGAGSNVFSSPRDTVRMVSASNEAVAGKVTLGLQFKLAPGWHVYWSNPGDAGLTPAVAPVGQEVFGKLRFPPPELFRQGGVVAYVLPSDVLLPFAARQVGREVTANASWLVCSDVCVPEHAQFSLALNGGVSAEAGLFGGSLIVPSPFPVRVTPDGVLSLNGVTRAQVASAWFFPADPGRVDNDAPQELGFSGGGVRLKLHLLAGAAGLRGVVELTDPSGQMQALEVAPEVVAAGAHVPFVLLAFLGGLVLNLMPCVFPVLAMKAVGFARMGGAEHGHIRREALGYTLGVVVAMLALAGVLLGLRAAGEEAGWGFQLQSPVVVALTGWLIFAVALNLAGVFEVALPGWVGRIPARHSVLSGALAVVVATPCTAPFMGAAVAAALNAPVVTALGIFLALGLGLAAPFLLLALLPRLAAMLPRPGLWMLWLQRVLAVPMLATFLWLGWVVFRQAGAAGVLLFGVGSVVLLLAVTRKKMRPLALASLLVLPFLHAQAGAKPLTLPGAEPYSAARLAVLRGEGRPVFVDLTAAWCVTCLVNEADTLNTASVRADFAAHRVALLVGDWTWKNPQITALLAANGRDGVPLYLYYAPGARAAVVLPQILRPGDVEEVVAGK